jgi:aldehyde dehydrogenase (NAD+)
MDSISMQSPSDIFRELEYLYSKQRSNSYKERIQQLKHLEQAILNHRPAIHLALKADLHKSEFESDTTEVFMVLTELRHTIKNLHHWMRNQKVDTPVTLIGTASTILHEPKGLILIIAPWNYPFALCISPLIYAIAAGNFVIVKPSEHAVNTSKIVSELIYSLFKGNQVKVVLGNHEISSALTKLPFHHIFFTGSAAIGKQVLKAAADNLTQVTLELGGKSPTIIDAHFDLNIAAKRIAFAKFINAGQTCIAPDFVVIHESRIDEFRKLFSKHIDQLLENKGLDCDHYVRIVNAHHFDRLVQLFDSMDSSERLVSDKEKLMIKPISIPITDWNHPLMQTEIFGPILPLLSYADEEKLFLNLSKMDRPLNLYVFSEHEAFINEVMKYTRSGGVTINECLLNYCNNYLPFGGDHHSGMGKTHGQYGFNLFSHQRAVTKQSFLPSVANVFTPPYSKIKERIKNFLINYF